MNKTQGISRCKTISEACCWRSFSFSPQPRRVAPQTLDPRFLHPSHTKTAIFKKKCKKTRGAAPGTPPPRGGGSVLRRAKNGWEIRLGRPWARPMFFSPPGGSQERSWTRLGVDLAGNRAPRAKQRVPGSILGAILAPKMSFFV